MTTKWAGWIVAALALAALAAGAVYAASHSAEVRITARQLEDGRVEFALQQRVGGEWGERQLPRSRFFPADVGHNRWLNSTPLTVSVAAEAESEPQSTVPGDGLGEHADSLCALKEVLYGVEIINGSWCTNGYGASREYMRLPAGRWHLFVESPVGCWLRMSSVDGSGYDIIHTGSEGVELPYARGGGRTGDPIEELKISVGNSYRDDFTPGEVEVSGIGCANDDLWSIIAQPR